MVSPLAQPAQHSCSPFDFGACLLQSCALSLMFIIAQHFAFGEGNGIARVSGVKRTSSEIDIAANIRGRNTARITAIL
jgi:hypothetical protein